VTNPSQSPKLRPSRLKAPPENAFSYRVDHACDLLGIGRVTFYKEVGLGKIRIIKIGGRTLVPRSEIERLSTFGSEG